jgi:hypothetical protein
VLDNGRDLASAGLRLLLLDLDLNDLPRVLDDLGDVGLVPRPNFAQDPLKRVDGAADFDSDERDRDSVARPYRSTISKRRRFALAHSVSASYRALDYLTEVAKGSAIVLSRASAEAEDHARYLP